MEIQTLFFSVALVAALFVGIFSPGAFIAALREIDLSKTGSGGTGFTNTRRALGTPLAAFALVVDVSKAALAVLAYAWLLPDAPPYERIWVGVAAVFGNTFLKYLLSPAVRSARGKGLGKGVAATFGVILALDTRFALTLLAIFLIFFVLSGLRISVGSLAASATMVFAQSDLAPNGIEPALACMATLIWVRHADNLYRLFWGIEPSFRTKRKTRQVATAGFIVHPTGETPEKRYQQIVSNKPWAKKIPKGVLMTLFNWTPVRLLKGKLSMGALVKINNQNVEVHILYWGVPFSAYELSLACRNPLTRFRALRAVIQAGYFLYMEGVEIVGLGAFTAIVGKLSKGRDLERTYHQAGYTDLLLTTGNVGTGMLAALEGVELYRTTRSLPKDAVIRDLKIGVIGASGSVGRAIVHFLRNEHAYVNIRAFGRSQDRLAKAYPNAKGDVRLMLTTSMSDIAQCDVIYVTVGTDITLDLSGVKAGAIIVDVSRPRVIARALAERKDVLVVDGGLAKIPGALVHGFSTGLPDGALHGCTAETLVLAAGLRHDGFERRHYSLGDYNTDDLMLLKSRMLSMGISPLDAPRYGEGTLPKERLDAFIELVHPKN